MKDAGIYGQSQSKNTVQGQANSDKDIKKRLDLIFCSVNRNKTNMDFEHFL